MINVDDLKLGDVKRGHRYDASDTSYRCIFCGARYAKGIIYPMEEGLVDAQKACERHILKEHGSVFEALIAQGKKATGLTEVQGSLMGRFYRQAPDKEISQAMGIAASTVRYQRHALREKARQAKVFLALSEMMEENPPIRQGDDLVKPHDGATMLDDRYFVTHDEVNAILRTYFSSMEPLRLKSLPSRQKRKIVILRAIANQFDRGTRYSGRDLDEILKGVYDDFATLRRYLIEYGFMERTMDGSLYWRK